MFMPGEIRPAQIAQIITRRTWRPLPLCYRRHYPITARFDARRHGSKRGEHRAISCQQGISPSSTRNGLRPGEEANHAEAGRPTEAACLKPLLTFNGKSAERRVLFANFQR